MHRAFAMQWDRRDSRGAMNRATALVGRLAMIPRSNQSRHKPPALLSRIGAIGARKWLRIRGFVAVVDRWGVRRRVRCAEDLPLGTANLYLQLHPVTTFFVDFGCFNSLSVRQAVTRLSTHQR